VEIFVLYIGEDTCIDDTSREILDTRGSRQDLGFGSNASEASS